MEAIKLISQALGNVLGSYFNSDTEVMSNEAKKIFSNEEDKRKYINAVEELKNSQDKQITITLSTREEITLVS